MPYVLFISFTNKSHWPSLLPFVSIFNGDHHVSSVSSQDRLNDPLDITHTIECSVHTDHKSHWYYHYCRTGARNEGHCHNGFLFSLLPCHVTFWSGEILSFETYFIFIGSFLFSRFFVQQYNCSDHYMVLWQNQQHFIIVALNYCIFNSIKVTIRPFSAVASLGVCHA